MTSDNGFMHMDLSNGARETGKWRTGDGRVCIDFRQFPSSCAPWRIAGDRLYVKRDSGEVLPLQSRSSPEAAQTWAGRRRSRVNGNSRLPCRSMVAAGTCIRPGVWPMREKRARRRLSAS